MVILHRPASAQLPTTAGAAICLAAHVTGGIGEHSGERSTRVPIKGGISEIGGRDGYCQ
jgi:hypothetical protein